MSKAFWHCAAMLLVVIGLGGCGRATGAPPAESNEADSPTAQAQDASAPLARVAAANAPLSARINRPSERQDDDAPEDSAQQDDFQRLERMRRQGLFAEFVAGALEAADQNPDDLRLVALKVEALLAVGRNEEAAATAEQRLRTTLGNQQAARTGQLLKQWAIARMRRQQPLTGVDADLWTPVASDTDPALELIRFWRDALAGRAAYRVTTSGSAGPNEILLTEGAADSVAVQLNAIQARANQAEMPMIFVDTGAQHTVMTVEAARAAGVRLGSAGTHLVGFAGLEAHPALLDTLELGGLTLHDVPVLVGNSAPLVALGGQMALGTELMHHVRFTIDYPGRRVTAEAAATPRQPVGNDTWIIPLWTFSQACLAHGETADGKAARVLVDTGDRAGTFVSARWARDVLPQFDRPTARLVFRFKPHGWTLSRMEIGNQSLDRWPVHNTIPPALERLGVVDLLLGHDLLGDYRVTVDVAGRRLELEPSEHPATHESGDAPLPKVSRN